MAHPLLSGMAAAGGADGRKHQKMSTKNPTYGATFDRVLSGDFEDADDLERAAAVQEVLQVSAIAASAVSIQPLPFVDMVLIAPIQIGMVQAIGRVHGHRLDTKAICERISPSSLT